MFIKNNEIHCKMSIILQFIQYYGDLNIHHYDSINIYNDIVYKKRKFI